tara:strand:- start:824 stop:1414 length:591 start_codon:yes stop_codon:yes gene_type:complete
MIEYIFQFHRLGTKSKTRADFNSDYSAEKLIELLKIDGYKIYQFILNDFAHTMKIEELKEKKIPFSTFQKNKKTWFGFSSKIVHDILIKPSDGFFYPYQFGNYLYLFTKAEISEDQFINWYNHEFPNGYKDLDYTFAGFNSENLNLINEKDYLIISCHDYQEQLGFSANKSIISQIIEKLSTLKLSEFELSDYELK